MSIELAPGRAGGLRLRNRVVVAAGGAGFGSELLAAVGSETPGAIITQSVTRAAHPGNPAPRMAPLPDGLLSSIGRPNPGLEAVVRRHAPQWARADVPIIVNLCGDSVQDIDALARSLDQQPDVAGVELDLSCPDRGRGGEPIGIDVEAAEAATVTARAATDLPLIVKLTADAPDIRVIGRAVAAAGADVISAIAPLRGIALTTDRRRARLGTPYGRLSGPAIKPTGLRVIYELAQAVRIPLIGIGGVARLDDVLDYLAAGATAVGMATAALADPGLPARLAAELAAWCRQEGLREEELVGRALPHRPDRGSLRQRALRR